MTSSSSSSSSSSFPLITSLVDNLKYQHNREHNDENNNNIVEMISLSCDSLMVETDYFDCNNYDGSNAEFDYFTLDLYVNMLSNAISNHGDKIKRVDLCWDFMQFLSNKETQQTLFRAISSIPNLKHLYVFYGEFEMQLSDLRILQQKYSALEILELDNVVLTGTEQEFERFCDTLKSNFQHSLKSIKLNDFTLPSEKLLDHLLQTISQLKELQTIELAQTHFEDPGISKESMQALCEMPKLTSLKIEAAELSTRTITGIAESLSSPSSSLKRLFLSGDNLDHCSALAIANALQNPNCTLENLHLSFESSDSILEDSDKMSFLDSSRSNCGTTMEKALCQNSSLKELTFNGCDFSDTVVSNILQENSTLKSLSLKNARTQEGSCIEIANTLSNGKNSTLEHLCLTNNGLGEDSGLAIANTLKINSTLKGLDFANNEVGETGWVAIANSLKFNQTLEVLNIDNACWFCNDDDDNDERLYRNIRNSLIDALQQNFVIKEISTHGMSLDNEHSNKLDFYLKLNSSDRRKKFFENSDMNQQHWLNHVITSQTTSDLSELHYFFRSMPSMLQKENSMTKKSATKKETTSTVKLERRQ